MFRIAWTFGGVLMAGIATSISDAPAGAQTVDHLTGTIKIHGSVSSSTLTQAAVDDFRRCSSGVDIAAGVSGTGGAFKRLVAGEIDIACASRPITAQEATVAKANGVEFIELPVAFEAVAVVVNPANDWCDGLTIEDLRAILDSRRAVRTWNDVRRGWPNSPIAIFTPKTDSGTFTYFKSAAIGEDNRVRSDITACESSDAVIAGVAGDAGGIGIVGFMDCVAAGDKIKVVRIDAGAGLIEPTTQTIEDGAYAPFSRPLLLYVNSKSAARSEMKGFVNFYLKNTDTLCERTGCVKLPKAIVAKALDNFKATRTGTQFIDAEGQRPAGEGVRIG